MLTLEPGEYGQSHPNRWPKMNGQCFPEGNLLSPEEAKECTVDRQSPQVLAIVLITSAVQANLLSGKKNKTKQNQTLICNI